MSKDEFHTSKIVEVIAEDNMIEKNQGSIKLKEIPQQCQRIEEALGRLNYVITELIEDLKPICRDNVPIPSDVNDCENIFHTSIGSNLASRVDTIERFIDYLNGIRDRLEL